MRLPSRRCDHTCARAVHRRGAHLVAARPRDLPDPLLLQGAHPANDLAGDDRSALRQPPRRRAPRRRRAGLLRGVPQARPGERRPCPRAAGDRWTHRLPDPLGVRGGPEGEGRLPRAAPLTRTTSPGLRAGATAERQAAAARARGACATARPAHARLRGGAGERCCAAVGQLRPGPGDLAGGRPLERPLRRTGSGWVARPALRRSWRVQRGHRLRLSRALRRQRCRDARGRCPHRRRGGQQR